jgi:hypothetical protein
MNQTIIALLVFLISFALILGILKRILKLDSGIQYVMLGMAISLSVIGYLSSPYLIQRYILGCEVDFIIGKTTYVVGDKTHYFYNLDSGLSTWSNTNLKVNEFICSP